MNSGRDESSVIARRERARMTGAAASAMIALGALAGCVPSGSSTSSSSSSSVPTASSTPSSTPLPTPEPLIIPGCDTLLPLSEAKTLFSPSTVVLGADDAVPIRGDDLPEIDTAAGNASVAKHCIWGVPNSDGGFTVIVTDISEADATNLQDALLATGFTGASAGTVTTLEKEFETAVGVSAQTHYLVSDLWVYVSGTSTELTVNVADAVLDEVRAANPTRTY
ncbi:hypothetical protein I6E52_08030 [Salinibacterium sp. NG253]|uniref:hypothetical protein n=1 Tax=Salinibacterium sp. NG253 TaxID=2792039 RepID=UPI0018CCBC2A|nr:hypothetical protein [Salinibacterium sp. NG253]MBH0116795.1 hypothetical protein [Salinibacterium sp. NG253]